MMREPPHRRFRIIFLFDKPITSELHYHSILIKLANEFPIIPKVERSPAQPVYGNGREDFNCHICGNILSLDDYPESVQPPKSNYTNGDRPKETLEDFLTHHGIDYEPSKDGSKLYVECPYRDGHTGQKQGKTDSYVWDDGGGWAYFCSHTHCKGYRNWEAFKTGHGIRNTYNAIENSMKEKFEPKVVQEDEEPMMVKFPEDLFFGVFDTYRRSLEDRIPIPDSFAFATLKHLFSATLGRRIHIESQVPIFPNFFTGLIGGSGEGHKGISLTVAEQLIEVADPNVLLLTRTSTEEGLLDLFKVPEQRTATDDDDNEYNYYIGGVADLLPTEQVESMIDNMDSHESIRVMGSFEELSAVLNRSKKVTFSGVTELLMKLYDMRKREIVANKGEKSMADYPTFTMMGASAFELIEQSLAQYFITGGFTNRIEWYMGKEKEPMLLYKLAKAEEWSECVEEIKKIRDSYVVGQSFTLTDEAYTLADKWNKEFTKHLGEVNNILVSGSMKRMKIFVLKNALIFAALEHRGTHEIIESDIINAIQLAEYSCTVVEKLFGNFASSEHQKVCNRIIEIIKKRPFISAKKIQNNMKWADPQDINMGLKVMTEMKMIEVNKPKRTLLYYVSQDED